jgi:hypothetical protein
VHHLLHPKADRLKTSQPRQVECCSSQAGQRTSAVAPVAVGILMELAVTDPVPALNTPDPASSGKGLGFPAPPPAADTRLEGASRAASAHRNRLEKAD